MAKKYVVVSGLTREEREANVRARWSTGYTFEAMNMANPPDPPSPTPCLDALTAIKVTLHFERPLSPGTLQTYDIYCGQLNAGCVDPTVAFHRLGIDFWTSWMLHGTPADQTVRTRFGFVHTVLSEAVVAAYMDFRQRDWLLKLIGSSVPGRPVAVPRDIVEEELDRMRAAIGLHSRFPLRDRALLELMLGTGIRDGDVTEMTHGRLDLVGCTARVFGKGHHLRPNDRGNLIGVAESKVPYVEIYVRSLGDVEPSSPVFPGRSDPNRGLSVSEIEKLFSRWVKWAGLEVGVNGKITPHSARHTTAQRMRRSGANGPTIATQMRQRSLESQKTYTAASTAEAKAALDAAWPKE